MFLQKTLAKRATVHGIGLHSGQQCQLTFIPAPPDTGVHFIRADLPNRPSLKVHAENVSATTYATTLGGPQFSVSTIEHCMSALSALRIDNLFVELSGPEIPIRDGSAWDFLKALNSAGYYLQDQPRQYCCITQPISYEEGDRSAQVLPYHGLRLTVTIEFSHPAIGHQNLDLDINERSFDQNIARARTFGFLSEVQKLQAQGLALGASLSNAIGLDETSVLNPEGLRFPDEFVRHKALDALGDLVTLSMPLMGHVVLNRAGHDIMNKLVRKILHSPQCFRNMELGADLSEEMQWRSSAIQLP